MEDVTRNSIYKLDYTAAQALADMQSAAGAATVISATSSSSSNSSAASTVNTSTGTDGQELAADSVIGLTVAPSTALSIVAGQSK